MPLTDLSVDEARDFCPEIPEPDGFDEFWATTLDRHEGIGLDVVTTPFDNRQRAVRTWDVRYAGYLGSPVSAWLHVPAGASGPMPVVVSYKGYSSSRGVPFATPFAAAGYAHLVIDPRGQGWAHPNIVENAPDDGPWGGGSGTPGWMTPHLDDPGQHYFRRLYTDAFRGLQVARGLEVADPDRVVLVGHSQGGAQAAAVAGLAAMRGIGLRAVCVDSPFLSCIRRSVDVASAGPYLEVVSYLHAHPGLVGRAFRTLGMFDVVHFASRARARALFSVAMMDPVCPPSTAWAAFNHWGERNPGVLKDINVYPFAEHGAGEDVQTWNQLGLLAQVL